MDLVRVVIAAAVPTAVYSLLIWWLDRYEKEPLHLIVIAFAWGAFPAIVLALLAEYVLQAPFGDALIGPSFTSIGLTPLIEEPLKALALLALYLWARREFDGPLDGIVYGALIGFGFAMTENALYFLRAPDLGASVWLRSVLFGLNHALFTGTVGLMFGVIRSRRNRLHNTLVLLGGLALAIVFHTLHNLLVASFSTGGVVLSWLVQSGGVLVILAVAALSWRQERRWIEDELGDEVRGGVLSPSDYAEVLSPSRRVRRQTEMLLAHGWDGFWQVRQLHHTATRLAFCKSKLRCDDRFHTCDDRDRLRQQVLSIRHAIAEQARA